MVNFRPVIKWSGSKRSQSEQIVSLFPDSIDTYYEPFLGGGSVMYQLVSSHVNVKYIVCSDINNDLISLWKMIKNSPIHLSCQYEKMWKEFNKGSIEDRKNYYYQIRNKFNQTHDPSLFLFISRTCTNGLIRYNKKGKFNSSCHFSRPGINPSTFKDILMNWSRIINSKDIQFTCCDYRQIVPQKNDFVYLDPPYNGTRGIYYGHIDLKYLWKWISNLKCHYALSFNGVSDQTDQTYDVPVSYSKHLYLYSGCSSFKRVQVGKVEYVKESLYLN